MLTIFDHDARSNRRAFLKVGSLALGGLSLINLLQAKASASPAARSSILKDRSVIFLFMNGGPSQFETFDPKMGAPAEIRSVTGEIQTRIPGVTFGSTFSNLAQMADKISIVRSFVPGDADHDLKPIVGTNTFGANLGSIFSRIAGANHPVSGLPTNMLLVPPAVFEKGRVDDERLKRLRATGGLGAAYTPFVPSASGNFQSDMRLNLPMNRLDDRRSLLQQFDQAQWALRDGHAFDGMDRIREQALTTLVGGVSDAFDLSKEDPRVLAAYDTEPVVQHNRIERHWSHSLDYVDHVKSFGKLLLLARRLCERGAGFVTITTNFVWDMHGDTQNKNATVAKGMEYVGGPFDHAVAAFIRDREERGLADKILLVGCGEMGRTPRVNATGGRDHWGNLGSLFFSGGGLRMGQVIGQSSSDGGTAASTPIRYQNIIATIMHQMFDMNQVRLTPNLPRDINQTMVGWDPINGLV